MANPRNHRAVAVVETSMNASRSGRTLVLALVVASAAALLAACGDDSTSGTTASVKGTTWVTSELTVNGVRSATPGGSRIELTLGTDGTVRARGGCNQMSGRYRLSGSTLTVEELGMTEMGCAAELMALDQTVATLLTARPTVTLGAGMLTVSSSSTTLELVDLETIEPTPPLTGTTWTLDTIITGQAASTIPQGLPRAVTLRFDEAGRYTIDTGCNGLGGTYRRTGTKLMLDPGPTTLIGCPAPLDTLEPTIAHVFSGEVTATIVRQRLTVIAKDGNGLGFTVAT